MMQVVIATVTTSFIDLSWLPHLSYPFSEQDNSSMESMTTLPPHFFRIAIDRLRSLCRLLPARFQDALHWHLQRSGTLEAERAYHGDALLIAERSLIGTEARPRHW